ncbi:MAG: hypothetical protein NC314_02015 [Roseburia sp.]|nr:hypothetical protein [Roseburia sp.]MCM1241591.1 hypothetical protein [Roseburia sp.]
MNKLTIDETLYFGFFILLSIAKGLGLYEGQKLFALLVIPALLCGGLKILLSSYTKRQWAAVLFLICLTGLVYVHSLELGIIVIMFLILGMKNISLQKVFRLGLWVWSACAVILCLISFPRLEHTVYRVAQKLGLGFIFRWSLGFTHPNILHITYLTLCALILYELADKFKVRHFVILMLGNVLVFLYSISYTGFAIVTVLLLGSLYVKLRPRFCLLEKILANLVLPGIIFISFALPFMLYDSRFAQPLIRLNELVNTRINIASFYLVPECMSLFGVKMSYLAQIQYYLSIDSSYIWAFIHYGIIPFVLLMAAYLLLIADYTKKQKTRELVMILCFLGAGYTEPLLFNTSFKNITLLFLGELLFRQKEGEEEFCLFSSTREKLENIMQRILEKVTKMSFLQWDLPAFFRKIRREHRKRILAAVAVCMLIGVIFCAILYQEPKGYVMPRSYTDWVEKSSVYLESAEDADYAGYRIMNYQDAETPMQVVEGNAVRLESVRYYVGSILIGGLAGVFIGAGTVMITDRERRL